MKNPFRSTRMPPLEVGSADPGAPARGTDRGLDTWPLHTPAWVTRLLDPAQEDEAHTVLRLLEIGFLPGEPVRLMATGPGGRDPLAVRVGHTTFALRRHEAALVRVSAQPEPA